MLNDVPPPVLAAAADTLRRLGPDRFSIGAVAEAAGISAEAALEVLGNREAAMKAALDHMGNWYFRALEAITQHEDTLAGAVAEGCVEFCAHRRRSDQLRAPAAGSSLLVQLFANVGGDLFDRTIAFWTPQVQAAQATGEVAADVDPRQAAEWIVRVMLSFELLPPIGVNLEESEEVRRFVSAFIVRGLGG